MNDLADSRGRRGREETRGCRRGHAKPTSGGVATYVRDVRAREKNDIKREKKSVFLERGTGDGGKERVYERVYVTEEERAIGEKRGGGKTRGGDRPRHRAGRYTVFT